MTARLPELLQRILQKSDVLAARYNSVKLLKEEAELENAKLKEEVHALSEQLRLKEEEIEQLRVSHKIAPSREDVDQSRMLLSQMIRKIDKCITQLERDEV